MVLAAEIPSFFVSLSRANFESVIPGKLFLALD